MHGEGPVTRWMDQSCIIYLVPFPQYWITVSVSLEQCKHWEGPPCCAQLNLLAFALSDQPPDVVGGGAGHHWLPGAVHLAPEGEARDPEDTGQRDGGVRGER